MTKAHIARGLLLAWLAAVAFPAAAVDSDNDGVDDSIDNCSQAANADQRDSNGDGFGNVCDADLNNDLIVNVIDLGMLKSVFFSPDADADANGDGIVNVVDLGAMKNGFFQAPGPGPVTPQGFNQRPARVEHDFDNNGIPDAESVFMYFADGRVLQQDYQVTGDGTPDLFDYVGRGFVQDFTYHADGRLASASVDAVEPSDPDVTSIYTFNGNGQLSRIDETVVSSAFPPFTQFYAFTYVNDLRVLDEIFSVPGDVLTLTRQSLYDASDRIDGALWSSTFTNTDIIFDFTWNASDKVIQKRTDIDGDGAFDEVVDYTHVAGRLVSKTTTGSLSFTPPDFTQAFIYAADGRLERLQYDANSDGSIDAVATIFWEDGPCELFFVPDTFPTGGDDGDAESAIGDLFACGP